MNIFYVDKNPEKAAKALCDKHIVKMVLESAQMMCAPFEKGSAPYRRTHFNHPSTKWARKSKEHYTWLATHAMALCLEYTRRYGRVHKSQAVITWCVENMDKLNFPTEGFEQPPQAMPFEYQSNNSVLSYRKYYQGEKKRIAKWKNRRKPPAWWFKRSK